MSADPEDLLEGIDLGAHPDYHEQTVKISGDTALGREGDSSEVHGTVAEVFRAMKAGEQRSVKVCPYGDCPSRPLPRGDSVLVARSEHGLSVATIATQPHNHDGERPSKKGGHWVTRSYWAAPRPPLQGDDHVYLGVDLSKGYEGGIYLPEYGLRMPDMRPKSPTQGTWVRLPDDDLERRAMAYSGRVVIAGERASTIRMRASDLAGVARVARLKMTVDSAPFRDPSWLAFRNGALNTKTDEFEPHAPHHCILAEHALPYWFDPSGRISPLWEATLAGMFRDDSDRDDKIECFAQMAGDGVLGDGTTEHRHVLAVGPGGGGKSLALGVVGALVAATARCSSPPSAWLRTFGRVPLRYARINLVSELEEREMMASGIVKAVLAGDEIEMEEKFKNVISIRPRAKHFFAMNKLPTAADRSHGFFRRFVIIGFNRIFSPEEQDASLLARLTHPNELGGIFAWAYAARKRRIAQGYYTIPESHHEALRAWREQGDTALAWASEALVADPGARERASYLYSSYVAWAKTGGYKALSLRTWGETMGAEFQGGRDKAGKYYHVRVLEDESAPALRLLPDGE